MVQVKWKILLLIKMKCVTVSKGLYVTGSNSTQHIYTQGFCVKAQIKAAVH